MAKIITRRRDPYGMELVVYRDGAAYGVASVSSHLRLIPVEAPDRFPTWDAANDRLEAVWRQRHAALNSQDA